MLSDEKLTAKYNILLPKLSENICRIYLASEALSFVRGGKSKIAKLTNVSSTRIDKGISEPIGQVVAKLTSLNILVKIIIV